MKVYDAPSTAQNPAVFRGGRVTRYLFAPGLLIAGLLPSSALAQATHPVDVSRHASVTITNAAVDAILAEGSAALQADDDFAPGTEDAPCDTTLARSGSVTLFQSAATPANPATRAAILQVLAEPAFVKVVASIGYCDQAATFHGCASRPGHTIAVVHPGLTRGLVWAHEFGHSTGLAHRGSNRELMRGDLSSSQQNFVNASECASFLQGAPEALVPGPKPKLIGSTAELPPIERFLDAAIVDRFPYALIARYPASVADRVMPVLDDPARALAWPNAAAVLGIVGGQREAKRLVQLAAGEAPAGVDGNVHHRARLAAVYALGYYLNRHRDRAVEAMLEGWASAAPPPVGAFASADAALGADRATSFRVTASWAMALAGRAGGDVMFKGRKSAALALDASTLDLLASTYRRVRSRGLAAYYAEPTR